MIDLVGFDGDDTLWHSQEYYDRAQDEFEAILGRYVDLRRDGLRDALLDTERGNIKLFGYGAKGMTLSMIESAIELTEGRVEARDIHRIVRAGQGRARPSGRIAAGYPRGRRSRRAQPSRRADHQGRPVPPGIQGRPLWPGGHLPSHRDRVGEGSGRLRALFREFDVTPDRFAMVGNSLRSDIAPVVDLGGWGVYMPYHSTWSYETDTDFAMNDRVIEVEGAAGIAAAIARMHAA